MDRDDFSDDFWDSKLLLEVTFLCGILLQAVHLPCASKWLSYRVISNTSIRLQKLLFTFFMPYYLWHAVSFLLSCRNETIDQISSTPLHLSLQPPALSLFLAHLCHDKIFKQVAHSVLLSVLKSYSPGTDLIKIEKKNKNLCHITLVVVLLMRCSEKLMLFKLKNTLFHHLPIIHSLD